MTSPSCSRPACFVTTWTHRFFRLALPLIWMATVGSLWAAPLVVTSDLALSEDTQASYDSITVSSGAVLTIGGGSEIEVSGSVSVSGSSSIVFAGKNTSAQIGGEWLGEGSVLSAASITIESGSAIHADGQGYLSNNGPGGSTSNLVGASYGGTGSGSTSTGSYGSTREPLDLGSAAGVFGSSTFGGGAIKLLVSGTIVVDGRISADGTASGSNHSGASGGSIWLDCSVLSGSGSIRANASEGGIVSSNTDSGGGRVSLSYEDASGFDLNNVEALGKDNSQDGTVYVLDTSATPGDILVLGRLRIEESESAVFRNVEVGDGGLLELAGGVALEATSVMVRTGGEVVAEGKSRTGQVDGAWIGEGVSITADTLTVEANASLHGDGEGYRSEQGPGGVNSNNTGASYGGKGSGSSPSFYGSQREPLDLGSASGVFGSATYGGGALRIDISGTLTVDGRISVNGEVTGSNHAGATGGSIWITTATLAGGGSIEANASEGGIISSNNDSSGGRVAVYYEEAEGFEDLSRIEAMGIDESQDGTVFLMDTDLGIGGLILYGRVRLEESDSAQFESIVVEETGTLELAGGVALEATSVMVRTGGEVVAEGKNRAGQVDGAWIGEGVSITADTLTVEANASLHGDGEGYRSEQGPGGVNSNNTGASYGGRGSGSSPSFYGSQREPLDLGSASGVFGSATYGGGALRIDIAGTLTVDGRISVNGEVTGSNHAGATGGSIWITTATLSGGGSIEANASEGGIISSNNDSSGGRVAVYYEDAEGFEDLSRIEAMGIDESQDGTVFLMDTDLGIGGLILYGRVRLEESDPAQFESIVVEETGTLELAGGVALEVEQSLFAKAGSEIVAEAKQNLESEDGVWFGEGVEISAQNVTVESGARLHADGQGYRSGGGPGGSTSNNAGSSYGGLGSFAQNGAYGSIRKPVDLGSAAGVFGSSTFGGGAIRITVEDTFQLDGSLTANGLAVGSNHSGATGGSIWVDTQILSGAGIIQANASATGIISTNRDSSGGRVALYYADASGFAALSNIEANGAGIAKRGTVYLRETDVPDGAMTIYSRLRIDPSAVETYGTIVIEEGGVLELGGESLLRVEDLTVKSGARIEAESIIDGLGSGKGITIEAGNLTVEENAVISADGWGFPSQTGPGGSVSNNIGASFGGKGTGSSQPSSYGDAFEPKELGSSSGVFGSSLAAGGAIRIDVEDTFTLDGLVSANGVVLSGNNHSGATGGSIWVTTETLAGSGHFEANASEGGIVSSNQLSGGGRVAVYYADASAYSGTKATSADASGENGEEGTAIFIDTSVEAGAVTVVERLDIGENEALWLGSLALVDEARMDIEGGSVLAMKGELSLTEDSLIDARSIGNSSVVEGNWKGRGSTLVAGSMLVDASSAISADGHGYSNGKGPGVSSSSNNRGASHGGKGSGDAGPVYGDQDAPTELGSAAGVFGSSTFGGGSIQVVVAETATVDGELSANGLAIGSNHSGATGGSIWILARELVGTGSIRADAAPGGIVSGNKNSGGGRIALSTVESLDGFALENVSVAAGGDDAEDGTISTEKASTLVWLNEPRGVVHDEISIGWIALGIQSTDTVSLFVESSGGVKRILDSSLAFQIQPIDTTELEEGANTFRLEIRSGSGDLIQEIESSAYVANSYHYHGGVLMADEVWKRGAPHIVEEDVVVPNGITLSIEPGAIVKFVPGTKIELAGGGNLVSSDSSAIPAVLTSYYDDQIAGDTNWDGAGTYPSNDDWRVLASVGSEFALNENTIFRFGNQTVDGRVSGTVRLAGNTTHVFERGLEIENDATLILAPGSILKIGYQQSIVVQKGGTILAEGTAADPVIITSIRDDSHGGDSNADGTATEAKPGDWISLRFDNAVGSFDHTHIFYGGGSTRSSWNASGAILTRGHSNVELRNSWLAEGFFDGVLAWGGPMLLENCVVEGFDRGISAHPGSPVTIRNSTIVDNRINVLMHGGTLNLYNSIVADAVEYGLLRDFGGTTNSIQNNIFWNPSAVAEVTGLPGFVMGEAGNVSVDPLLYSPRAGYYLLSEGSPAIDFGIGENGSAKDILGYPRFDDPTVANSGTPLASGAYGDLGAFEYLQNWESPYDLVVTEVSGPASAEIGESVTIEWTVKNEGDLAIEGPWHDAVYLLSNEAAPQPTLAMMGLRESGEGVTLEPGGEIDLSAVLSVPGAVPGNLRWQVETNKKSEILEGQNRSNNSTRSVDTVAISMPRFGLGQGAFATSFEEDGSAIWLKLDPSSVSTLLSVEVVGSSNAVTEVYLGYGRLPTTNSYDAKSSEWGEDDVSAIVPEGDLPVYALIIARTVRLPGVAVSVQLSEQTFSVGAVSPGEIGDEGEATLEVPGVDLSEGLTFELVPVAGGESIEASQVYSTHSNVAYPTFPMDGVARGNYRVRVSKGAASELSTNQVEVVEVVKPRLKAVLNQDAKVRAGRSGTVSFEYENVGNVDLRAPLMKLVATVPVSRPSLRPKFIAPSRTGRVAFMPPPPPPREIAYVNHFVALSDEGPAGIIRPSAFGGRFTTEFTAPLNQPDVEVEVYWLSEPGFKQAFPWASLESGYRPLDMPDEGWALVWGNFTSLVGSTMEEVNETLAQMATDLGRVGRREQNLFLLSASALRFADPFGHLGTIGSGGAFGDQYPDITRNDVLSFNPAYKIVRMWGHRREYFYFAEKEVYLPLREDGSQLRVVDGSYVLKEFDGVTAYFDADAKLSYLENNYGMRTEFRYEEGRLIEIGKPGETALELTYNAEGKVTSMGVPDGPQTTYQYQGSNLTRIERPDGYYAEMSYYEDGPAAGLRRSITLASGETMTSLYDEYGRLESIEKGDQSLAFEYVRPGIARSVDNLGSVAEYRMDSDGILRQRIFDGNVVRDLEIDFDANITKVELEGGISRIHTYDDRRKFHEFIDPMGERFKVVMTEGNQIGSVIDERGFATSFSYNAQGDRIEARLPDGRRNAVAYNSSGRSELLTFATGDTIRLHYDERNRLVRKEFSDDTEETYTYDSLDRIATATNEAGTTTISRNEIGQLTGVAFPNGKSISYAYDDIGRVVESNDGSGHVVRRVYNANGGLDALTDGAGNRLLEFSRDDRGRLARITRSNGTVSDYNYTARSHFASIGHTGSGGSDLASASYQHDGNLRRVAASISGNEFTYQYDNYSRLTEAVLPDDTLLSYAYDPSGNLAEKDGDTYLVNSAHELESAGAETFVHDELGRMIERSVGGDTWTYEYDIEGLLTRVQGPGVDSSYTYDAIGFRIGENNNGVETLLLYDVFFNESVFTETTSGQKRGYLYGIHGYGAVVSSSYTHFYHYDGNGNVIGLSDASGVLLNSYLYSPYGSLIDSVETVANPLQFAARHGARVAPHGAYWIGIRQYDPALGRFLTPDPIVSEGESPYVYAASQPTNLVDYTGYESALDSAQSTFGTELTVANSTNSVVGSVQGVMDTMDANQMAIAGNEMLLDNIEAGIDLSGNEAVHAVQRAKTANLEGGLSNRGFEVVKNNVNQKLDFIESGPDGVKNFEAPKVETPGGKALKSLGTGMQIFGSVLTAKDTVETTQKYQNGQATGLDLMRVYVLQANDIAGYTPHPIVQGVTAGISLWDVSTNYALDSYYQNKYGVPDDMTGFGPRGRELLNKYGPEGIKILADRMRGRSQSIGSFDPNDKASTGFGEQGFINEGVTIEYKIRFENLKTASAAAQEVWVSDFLDEKLDLSTLQLVEFGFNLVEVPIAGAPQNYQGIHYVETDPNPVDARIELDLETRELLMHLRTFDAVTNDYPDDPEAGFLPPNDDQGRGEGYLIFRARPVANLASGTEIRNDARIVFDLNEPIDTNVVVNTIDTVAPTSSVQPFAANATASAFIEVAGDDSTGSGIERFEIYVSKDGGGFEFWNAIPGPFATFNGEVGTEYAFYSIAVDQVGNREGGKTSAEASVIPSDADDPFHSWSLSHFSAEDFANPHEEIYLWGLFADPDRDGLSNFLERYFGLDPLADDAMEVFGIRIREDRLELFLRESTAAIDLEGRIEMSVDLEDWGDLTEDPTTLTEANGIRILTLPLDETKLLQFYRLVIEEKEASEIR